MSRPAIVSRVWSPIGIRNMIATRVAPAIAIRDSSADWDGLQDWMTPREARAFAKRVLLETDRIVKLAAKARAYQRRER